MKTQLLITAINNGIEPLLYGENATSIYALSYRNLQYMGEIHLTSKGDVLALLQALTEEWLKGQQVRIDSDMHSEALAIFNANARKSIPAIVRSMRDVNELVRLYNATHSQQLAISKIK